MNQTENLSVDPRLVAFVSFIKGLWPRAATPEQIERHFYQFEKFDLEKVKEIYGSFYDGQEGAFRSFPSIPAVWDRIKRDMPLMNTPAEQKPESVYFGGDYPLFWNGTATENAVTRDIYPAGFPKTMAELHAVPEVKAWKERQGAIAEARKQSAGRMPVELKNCRRINELSDTLGG